MRSIKINDILGFIRRHTNLLKDKSNNDIRNWAYKKMRNKNLFFHLQGENIYGIIEWYRYCNIDGLINDFKTDKLGGTDGVVLYIRYLMFRPEAFNRGVLYKFMKYQENKGNVEHIFRLQIKDGKDGNEKFRVKKVLGRTIGGR